MLFCADITITITYAASQKKRGEQKLCCSLSQLSNPHVILQNYRTCVFNYTFIDRAVRASISFLPHCCHWPFSLCRFWQMLKWGITEYKVFLWRSTRWQAEGGKNAQQKSSAQFLLHMWQRNLADYEIRFAFYNVIETQVIVQYFETLTNHVSDKLLVITRATSTEIAALWRNTIFTIMLKLKYLWGGKKYLLTLWLFKMILCFTSTLKQTFHLHI